MTSYQRSAERKRDQQDGFERHVWGEQTFVKDAGSVIKVRGTGTVDEEAPVMNNGVGMHMKKDSNTEVFLFASGSDTGMKMAALTIPRNKQRNWKEDTNGIQHATDPDFALEFNKKRAHITKDKFAVGMEGIVEVIDGKVYIRADEMIVKKVLYVNEKIVTPLVENGTKAIPGFEA